MSSERNAVMDYLACCTRVVDKCAKGLDVSRVVRGRDSVQEIDALVENSELVSS